MQTLRVSILPFVLVLTVCPTVSGLSSNPLGKVLELIDDLAAKITKDGEADAKAYHEYFEWCDETSKNTEFAIKTAATEKERLVAKIDEKSSTISEAEAKIEDLAASIAKGQAELKDASAIRKNEAADFSASEGELMDSVDTLGRAIGIISKESAKNPASLAQVDSTDVTKALSALRVVLDAASFTSKDHARLTALVQQQQQTEADDLDFGAPAVAAYNSHSSGIMDVLEDMKEKAETQLGDLRKAEVNNRHNFEMVKQSLVDQAAADTKDLEDEKASKASAEEAKATAEGELEMASKGESSSTKQLATVRSSCMQVAADHEVTVAARKEELGVIAEAKKSLEETSSGAVSQTYSLLQSQSLTKLQSQNRFGSKVVSAVKQLARKHRSVALKQLASRIATVLHFHSSDPFTKVKGLIENMIAKLEKEASEEATEKAYCDEQLAKTEEKKTDLESTMSKIVSKIDQATSKLAQLKQDIKTLEGELAALAKEQGEMDQIRQDSHAAYTVAKSDLELGLSGVRKALDILRDYYGAGSAASVLQDDAKFGAFMQQPAPPETHSKSQGAGDGLISILQVVESDFATSLAKEETAEADAQSEYEKITQDNKVTKTAKESDVKYKSQESKALEKAAAEFSADRDTTSDELTAVLEYDKKLKNRCIAKPESYKERKARREAEIKGLQEALSILEDDMALVQRKRRGSFRGSLTRSSQ